MIFVDVRFYRKDDLYHTAQLGFKTDDLTKFTEQFEAFRMGYAMGSRMKIGWDLIRGYHNVVEKPFFIIPTDIQILAKFLKDEGYYDESTNPQDQRKA